MRFLAIFTVLCGVAFPQASQRALLISQHGGVVTTARSCNGTSSDHLTNGTDYLSLASTFTVAAWVKSANVAQPASYIWATSTGGNQNALLYGFVNSSGLDEVEFYAPGHAGATDPRTSSVIVIPDTNWHHVAYRYNGTAWDKFLDGTKTSINASAVFTLALGSGVASEWCDSTGGGGAPFAGSIARFYVSTSALSDGQIAALASGTCSSSGVSGTVGYWLEGVGSPEPESSPSPNTNSQTVTGTTIVAGPVCSSQ